MKKKSVILFIVMIFIIMFSGCKSNDNNSESISGETDTNVTDTIELKYFPIAIDDAGIVLPRADLSQFPYNEAD